MSSLSIQDDKLLQSIIEDLNVELIEDGYRPRIKDILVVEDVFTPLQLEIIAKLLLFTDNEC